MRAVEEEISSQEQQGPHAQALVDTLRRARELAEAGLRHPQLAALLSEFLEFTSAWLLCHGLANKPQAPFSPPAFWLSDMPKLLVHVAQCVLRS